MKKPVFIYGSALIVGIALSFGIYVITSWLILNYKLLREESIHTEIFIVAENISDEDAAAQLLNKWLSEFKKDVYVQSKIEEYFIHSMKLEEQHDDHFIFSARYSIIAGYEDTAWKNAPHVEDNGRLILQGKFRVNKVNNRYTFRIASDEGDPDFAR
jgi:hypothetical protein